MRKLLLESGRKAIELLDGYGEDDHLPYRELEKSMTSQDTALYIPVEICSGISEKAASGMEKAKLSGINVRTDHVRYYPQGSLASHIIGYVGSISEEETDEYNREKGYRNDDIIGKSGIERYCESSLKGVDGRTGYQVDASGKVRGTLESRKAERGSSVRLTIDFGSAENHRGCTEAGGIQSFHRRDLRKPLRRCADGVCSECRCGGGGCDRCGQRGDPGDGQHSGLRS